MNSLRLASGGNLILESLIKQGGEGAVYRTNRPDLVAKIYLQPQPAERVSKLRAMAARTTPDLMKLCAWPTEILENYDGELKGFLMPLIAGREEAHMIATVSSRRKTFPKATWPMLVHLGTNIAAAMETIHRHDMVIGDVNEGGFLVADDATIRVIDTDSFQFQHQGVLYPCRVGVPEFTPPELQGIPGGFAKVTRTANHDLFGLATILFRLLMAGRWPYSGRPLDGADLDMAEAIAQYRYAYASDAQARKMAPPPATLPLSILGPQIPALFERAFTEPGRTSRPSAQQWLEALKSLRSTLQACPSSPVHHHPRGMPCPWCSLEQTTGVVFFLAPMGAGMGVWVLRIGDFERELARYPELGKEPFPSISIPPATGKAVPQAILDDIRQVRGKTLVIGVAFLAVALLVCLVAPSFLAVILFCIGLIFLVVPGQSALYTKELQARESAYAACRSKLNQLQTQWGEEYRTKYAEARKELASKLTEYRLLDDGRNFAMKRLEAERRNKQLHEYLEDFDIAEAAIDGIGKRRVQTLQGYGFFTAADVTGKVGDIPRFGPKLTNALLDWRRALEQRFQFDPAKQLDPSLVQRALQPYHEDRQRLEARMNQLVSHLGLIQKEMAAVRGTMRAMVETATKELTQSIADLDVIKALKNRN